jgi:hypothetical protein
MATSVLGSGSAVQWPDRVGSGKIAHPSIRAWFDTTTSSFQAPKTITVSTPTGDQIYSSYGNSGRNILYGPGTEQFDVSLFKNFRFDEAGARHLQLRVETFNIFNTPQFNNPNAQIGGSTVGTITSAGQPLLFQRTSREIQLAGKFYF